MNLAFIHDHTFIVKNNCVYTTGGLPSSVWSLYLNDNKNTLNVFGRLSSNKKSNTLSSFENVSFIFSKFYKSPLDYFLKKSKIKNELKLFLKNKQGVIIRLPSFLGLIAHEICEENNIPYAVEVVANAYDALFNYGNIQGKLIASYIHNINKNAILKSKYTIYVTKNFLQKSYPNKNFQVYASDVQVDDNPIGILENKIKKLNNTSEIICGTIGNLEVKYKGYQFMLQAIKKLKEQHNIKLIYKIAGAGSFTYLYNLSKKLGIEDQVISVGKLDRNEVLDFLDNLTIYVHPSLQEGLPRVVVEAMSRACPCLTSKIGGIPELIEEEFLHKPKDYVKLSNDILKMINNKELLLQQAKNNFYKSKEYSENILLDKRKKFWNYFFNQIELKK